MVGHSKDLIITNSGGYIVVENTVTGDVERYPKVAEYNKKTFEVKLSDGDSYLFPIDMDRVQSPTITNGVDLQAWIDGLVLGGASGAVTIDDTNILTKLDDIKTLPKPINAPIVTVAPTANPATDKYIIVAGFWDVVIEAPTGMIDGSTVEINGITYDDGFIGKEFTRIHSGADIEVFAKGNNIVITEVR